MSTFTRKLLLLGCSALVMLAARSLVLAQEQGGQGGQQQESQQGGQPQGGQEGGETLPQVTVSAPKQAPKRPPQKAKTPPRPRPAPTPVRAPAAPPPTPEQREQAANRTVVQGTTTMDQRRDQVILPKVGANTDTKDLTDLENIPQGGNAQLSDILVQFPGVSNDSTSQGDFHIRNEHGNTQFRINGILLPADVSGFSQILETNFFKSMTLITGALPAQYGLRTSGIVDLTTKTGQALAGGSVSLYGGDRQTMTGSFEYGGVIGNTDYFTTGRLLSTGLGLEGPLPTRDQIHDHSVQGRFFSYTSTLLDPQTRLSTIYGMAESKFQIPTNVGQPLNAGGFAGGSPCALAQGGAFSAWCITNFDSSKINQNQFEKNFYGVVAWQRSVENFDTQLTYYNRYSDQHFVPDLVGDLLFNNIASDVFRSSFLNGVAGDSAYTLNAHTLRAGFYGHAEFTRIKTIATVENCITPVGPQGNCPDSGTPVAFEPPFNILDTSDKLGWQFGAYVQDEWRLTPQLTLNYGLRFDQIFQYVNKDQFSPRAALNYNPWWGTLFHVGYARYFTPVAQVLGRTVPNGLFFATTGAPEVANSGSILPERANVYDIGIVQQVLPRCPEPDARIIAKAPIATSNCPKLEVGVDAYYKEARDLIDDGQFGQAYVLTAFNYAKGINKGVEAKAKFEWGNFRAYTNWAVAIQKATDVVSNQSLFSPDDLAYIATHWIYTDHAQYLTGSAGVSYLFDAGSSVWWDGIKVSATLVYGSGLRQDLDLGNGVSIPNGAHVPAYHPVNLGISKEFKDWGLEGQPVTVRFDVVNVFDEIYLIRSGSGIGVFAPQFGPRLGFYGGISQKLGSPDGAGPRFEPLGKSHLYTKAVMTPMMYNWTGGYVGVHFGGVFTKEDVTVGAALFGTPMTAPTNPSGALGGVQAGYNYQFQPNLMAGIEAELSWGSATGKANPFNSINAGAVQSDQRWYDTLTGRLGYVDGPLLIYAKGGAAWMNARYMLNSQSGYVHPTCTNTPDFPCNGVNGTVFISNTRLGWTAGAGIEYLLSPRWSAKAEYSFLDFGSHTVATNVLVPGNSLTADFTRVHELKAGVNYHWPL
jgi:opacity protein-like surface antigen/outer membrane receptor protein involved in Fe transport